MKSLLKLNTLRSSIIVLITALYLVPAIGKHSSENAEQVKVAKQYLALALIELESRQQWCKGSEIVLGKTVFEDLSMTQSEIGLALRYFDVKTEVNCSLQQASSVATWQYTVNALTADENTENNLDLVLHFARELVLAEAKYKMNVNAEKRTVLEQRIDINQPIDLMASAMALEI